MPSPPGWKRWVVIDMSEPIVQRVYAPLLSKARALGSRETRMKTCVDAVWDRFSMPMHPPADTIDSHEHTPISWVGFYLKVEGKDELVLSYCRNKPACSPIGLHGVCGRGYTDRCPALVVDVKSLGPNYIACDPNDKSEVVVPLLADDGSCMGVLDVDSHHVGAFSRHDVKGLTNLLQRYGLTSRVVPMPDAIEL